MKKNIILAVLALAVSFTVQAQTVTGTTTPIEKVAITGNYIASNVSQGDLAAKIADAKAECPGGKTITGPFVSYNPKNGLFTVTASYR